MPFDLEEIAVKIIAGAHATPLEQVRSQAKRQT
jgi:hypothetical protein